MNDCFDVIWPILLWVGRCDNRGMCHMRGNLRQCCHLWLRLSWHLLIIDGQCNGNEITNKNLLCWTSLRIFDKSLQVLDQLSLPGYLELSKKEDCKDNFIFFLEHNHISSHTTADICIRLRFRNHRSMSGPLGPRSSYSQSHCSSSMSPCQTTQQDRSSPTPQDTTTHTPKPHHLSVRTIEHAIYLPLKSLLDVHWFDQRSVQYLIKCNNLW